MSGGLLLMSVTGDRIEVAVVVALVVYLLPGIIALRRKERHALAVFAVDLLFGWTVVGWFATTVWATGYASARAKTPLSWLASETQPDVTSSTAAVLVSIGAGLITGLFVASALVSVLMESLTRDCCVNQ